MFDEHVLLDDNKYIADILYEFRNSKRELQSKLLFKKRMFRETDETVIEPQFITLSYVQVSSRSAWPLSPQVQILLPDPMCTQHSNPAIHTSLCMLIFQ